MKIVKHELSKPVALDAWLDQYNPNLTLEVTRHAQQWIARIPAVTYLGQPISGSGNTMRSSVIALCHMLSEKSLTIQTDEANLHSVVAPRLCEPTYPPEHAETT